MGYSTTDLANIQAAVTALATGARKAAVWINGKRIDYALADLDQLTRLRDQAQAEVNAAAGHRSFFLTSTGKGL